MKKSFITSGPELAFNPVAVPAAHNRSVWLMRSNSSVD